MKRAQQVFFVGFWVLVALALCFGVLTAVKAAACSNAGGVLVESVYGWPTCVGADR